MEYSVKICIVVYCCILMCNICSAVPVGDQCKQVENIDCSNGYKPEGNETVCCSDMNVYNNLCFFAQQKCKDPSLTVLYPGHCVFATPPADIKPTTTLSFTTTHNLPVTAATLDPILEAFCDNRNEIVCDDDLDPVCGTDDKFYKNNCVFAKARCDNIHLGLQTLAECKASQRLRRSLQSP